MLRYKIGHTMRSHMLPIKRDAPGNVYRQCLQRIKCILLSVNIKPFPHFYRKKVAGAARICSNVPIFFKEWNNVPKDWNIIGTIGTNAPRLLLFLPVKPAEI